MRTVLLSLLLFFCAAAAAEPIKIVAAENIYGSVAQELGGKYVTVYSILNNPNQDPHLFSACNTTAKAISNADIVIANGAGYDNWEERLLSTNTKKRPSEINVAALINKATAQNPHIWYEPSTMPIFAQTLTALLIKLDGQHADYYATQLRNFQNDYMQLTNKIAAMKRRFQGIPVTATEPVFNYMADDLGLIMHELSFQINIMNDVEPTPMQVKEFEDELRNHKVKLLIYNNQVVNPRTQHMRYIAQIEKIPVVGVSEMLPPRKTYVQWMLDQLKQMEQALSAQH